MRYFRNPEIKRELAIYILFLIIFVAAISISDRKYFILLSTIICILYTVIHFVSSYFRYKKICKMSDDIDNILHYGYKLNFEEYTEGELAVLANEIHKVVIRLTESENSLKNDKTQLMNSIADISHQLRTPLTSINLIITLLSDYSKDDTGYRELISKLRKHLMGIEWLIESLLKMSRFDAGAVTLANEQISVASLMKKVEETLSIPLELRNVELITEAGHETYMGDMKWSHEAFCNIVKNCMEHTPPGGKIYVSAKDNTLFTEIVVKDTGSGFVPSDIPHLFERFYKGSNASKDSFGIGLALARMIIAAQNGTIKAMNYDGGACFCIRFYKGTV